jgi:hypothetical protein
VYYLPSKIGNGLYFVLQLSSKNTTMTSVASAVKNLTCNRRVSFIVKTQMYYTHVSSIGKGLEGSGYDLMQCTRMVPGENQVTEEYPK